jgi:hypothetical protein
LSKPPEGGDWRRGRGVEADAGVGKGGRRGGGRERERERERDVCVADGLLREGWESGRMEWRLVVER